MRAVCFGLYDVCFGLNVNEPVLFWLKYDVCFGLYTYKGVFVSAYILKGCLFRLKCELMIIFDFGLYFHKPQFSGFFYFGKLVLMIYKPKSYKLISPGISRNKHPLI